MTAATADRLLVVVVQEPPLVVAILLALVDLALPGAATLLPPFAADHVAPTPVALLSDVPLVATLLLHEAVQGPQSATSTLPLVPGALAVMKGLPPGSSEETVAPIQDRRF